MLQTQVTIIRDKMLIVLASGQPPESRHFVAILERVRRNFARQYYRLRKLSKVTTSAPVFSPAFSDADLPEAASAGLAAGTIGEGTTAGVAAGGGFRRPRAPKSGGEMTRGAAELRTPGKGGGSKLGCLFKIHRSPE